MLRWSTAHRETDWIRQPGVSLDFGPAGFTASARLRSVPDPTAAGQQEGDLEWPDAYPRGIDLLVDAVAALTPHTATSDEAFYLVWDSGVSGTYPDVAHRVRVPDRDPSYVAEGRLADLPTWHEALRLAEYDSPSFIWPRDRAWCIAWDVDPHFAGVGGSNAAIAALLAVPRLHAVPHDPATKAQYYY